MNRINNIKLIEIQLGKTIKLEITRVNSKDRLGFDNEEVEEITFDKTEEEKYRSLEEFVEVFNLMNKVVVRVVKEWKMK